LLCVIIIGGGLRLYNVNWDSGYHLHPDERYVTMVANDIKWPSSWAEYLDVSASPLSPYNAGKKDYLYGTLPLFATKYVAGRIKNPEFANLPDNHDNYGQLNLVGRSLSAVIDTLSILLVFLVAQRFFARHPQTFQRKAAVVAAIFYALCVTAIQNAHFFTMESWLVFFTLLTFYLTTLLTGSTPPHDDSNTASPSRPLLLLLTGISFGLTVACKANGAFILLAILVALVSRLDASRGIASFGSSLLKQSTALLIILVTSYLTFRFCSPYAFATSNWFSLTPNPHFMQALEQQRKAVNGEFLFPPSYQWLLSTPLISPLKNVVVWGLGLPLGLVAVTGCVFICAAAVARFMRRKANDESKASQQAESSERAIGLMLLTFVTFSFLYAGSRFAHTVRYLVPIAPFLCLAAVYALVHLRERQAVLARRLTYAVVILTALYTAAFMHIYRQPTTRVAATAWMNQHIPRGSRIIWEYWDDPLPLTGGYQGVQFEVFQPDDETKLKRLHDGLADGDYYSLSSPRAWRTVGLLPDRFPFMARFYKLLFEGKLGFERVAEFNSSPQLFGITIPDVTAEETFWVYDHPPVIILQKTKTITREEFESLFADLKGKEVRDPAHPNQ